MMEAFTESVDTIYCDLDKSDLDSLHFEASFKDIGKAVSKAALPAAAIGAVGVGAYNILNPQTIEDMTPKERYDHALAEYQHPIVVDTTANLSTHAERFSKYWISLSPEQQTRINAALDEYRRGVPVNLQGRLKEFAPWVKYWIDFEKDQQSIDQWETNPDDVSIQDFDPLGNRVRMKRAKKESTMKTFETFENKVSKWVTEADSKFDQDVFNILSDMEAEIETGEYPQEEIVDTVSDRLAAQQGRDLDTEEGARIEQQVEDFYAQLGLDSVPADRRSRDYVPDAPLEPPTSAGVPVPGKVEGQPWVHSDDDFIFFLRWLIKQVDDNDEPTFNAKRIVDVIEEPHHYMKEYKQFLDNRQRVDDDPYL